MSFSTLLYVYGMAAAVLVMPTWLVIMFAIDRRAPRKAASRTAAHPQASGSPQDDTMRKAA
jgi:hypothetical protein